MYLWKDQKNIVVVILLFILTVFTGFTYEQEQINSNDENKINWNQYLDLLINAEESEINSARNEIMSAILAYHVEEIVKGAENDQDKCIRIAEWIASNISNREPLGQDEYGWYAYRTGLCGSRARLFVEMLKYQHIPARVFNIYNFGKVGGGHSCAQAFYNEKWHFFDVTYAGVFMKDNNVLSWEEIVSNPKEAMESLVVFEDTLDRNGSIEDDTVNRKSVNNNERMHTVYSEDILTNTRSYGFLKYTDVKTLYPLIDWNEVDEDALLIGHLNNNCNDVCVDGVDKKISERLGVSLGTSTDTFHTTWEFKNCTPDEVYSIKYYIYDASDPGIVLWARTEDAKLLSGGTFAYDESLAKGNPGIWEIKFIPNQSECSISVGYDFRDEYKLLFVDMIEITEQ